MNNEEVKLFLALSQQERDIRVKEEMKRFSVIYIHTSPSGRSYVGQTCSLGNARWHQHKYSAKKGVKSKFATALRKYDREVDWDHGILWVFRM